MKKIILILSLFVLCVSSSFAQQKEFDSGQRSIRDGIQSFLRNEGYLPTIDEEGDIKFKIQGDVYFVIVSDIDSSPYYVRLAKFYSYGETFNKQKILSLMPEINKYKMLKLQSNESNFSLEFQMFLENTSSFTNIFNRVLRVLETAEEEMEL